MNDKAKETTFPVPSQEPIEHLKKAVTALNSMLGKTVRVTKADPKDEAYGIPVKGRWKKGDQFEVRYVEIKVYGCFLFSDKEQNLNINRAEII